MDCCDFSGDLDQLVQRRHWRMTWKLLIFHLGLHAIISVPQSASIPLCRCHKHAGQLTNTCTELDPSDCRAASSCGWTNKWHQSLIGTLHTSFLSFRLFKADYWWLSSEHSGDTCRLSCHLTKCGFHLWNMVLISPLRWTAFSSFLRSELRSWSCNTHQPAIGLFIWKAGTRSVSTVKRASRFNCWSFKWGFIKMNDLL